MTVAVAHQVSETSRTALVQAVRETKFRTSRDDPAGTLLRVVDGIDAHLLVIGARRRSPVGKALLGSVAQT